MEIASHSVPWKESVVFLPCEVLIRSSQSLFFSGLNNPSSQSELQILSCPYGPLLDSLCHALFSTKLLLEPFGTWPVLLLGIIPPQVQEIFLIFTVVLSAHFSIMWRSLMCGNATIQCSSYSSPFCIACWLAELMLCSIIQGINADVKLYSFQY